MILSSPPKNYASFAADPACAAALPYPPPQPWFAPLTPRLRRAAKTLWKYLQGTSDLPLLKRRGRRLRVSETLSLGDKRFVSILEVDGQSFLVGGSGASLALLATLATEQAPPFERVLCDSLQRNEVQ